MSNNKSNEQYIERIVVDAEAVLQGESTASHFGIGYLFAPDRTPTGLQDAVKGYRTNEQRQLDIDINYINTQRYEDALPVVNDWLQLIPEWSATRELVIGHVRARCGDRAVEVLCEIPDEAIDKVQAALMEFYDITREIAYKINNPTFKPNHNK